MNQMAHEKTATVTVRLRQPLQDRLHQLKLSRAAVTEKWPTNQELVVEALELLLVDVVLPEETADAGVDTRQLSLL